MCDKVGGTNGLRRLPRTLLLAVAMLARPALALDPHTRLQDFNHTTWTARDGAPAHVDSMVQTADGWIWLTSITGLYRFDGSRFEAVVLPRQDEPGRGRVNNLFPAPNGDLWINYTVAGGLSVLHPDGSMEDVEGLYGDYGYVRSFALAPDGAMWAATESGLRVSHGKRSVVVGAEAGLPPGHVDSLMFEPDGSLWVSHEQGIYRRPAAAARFERRADSKGFTSLIRSADGKIWAASQRQDRVELLASPAAAAGGKRPADVIESRLSSIFDRDGNLWSAACARQLCYTAAGDTRGSALLQPAKLVKQGKADALASMAAPVAVMEDSEGSIWVATETTIERFRDSRLAAVRPLIEGAVSMADDDSGRAWIVQRDTESTWIMSASGAVAVRGQPFQLVTKDSQGGILLAGRRELQRRRQGRVEKIVLPPGAEGKVMDLEVLGVQDDGRVIWMYTMQTGLVGYVDGRWQPHGFFNLPSNIMLTTPGGDGKLWTACGDRSIVLYDRDKLARYDGAMIGAATVMQQSEQMVIAGDRGMAVLKGERFVKLRAAQPEVLQNVSGIAISHDGDRWLNGGKGLVHVRAADWRASMATPTLPLRYELLDTLDGYTGRAYLDNRLPSALADKDGQLWLATTDGVLHMDTAARRVPALPPRIAITAFHSDGAPQPLRVGDAISLPPAPRNVNIDYAAPGMGKPEGVRFQYRLVGEDASWQDAGARRTAFYTSLAAGRHRFEVRAANHEGQWSTTPAALEFAVAPTLSQTGWFRTAMAALALAVLWLLYRWRLRNVSAQIRARMDERIDERNRIARELHDTVLQSVQGLMLKVHGAAMRLGPGEPVKPLLESALQQAEITIAEARARVRDLRGDDDASLSLAEMLGAVGRELGSGALGTGGAAPQFALHMHGQARDLTPAVSRELFGIGREAIVNAFRHAGAGRIEVGLTFGKSALTMQVTDDGCGIPADFSGVDGRAGHWGIGGMRERARAIGAQLEVGHADIGGTSVVATVPAARAYKKGAVSRVWPMKS